MTARREEIAWELAGLGELFGEGEGDLPTVRHLISAKRAGDPFDPQEYGKAMAELVVYRARLAGGEPPSAEEIMRGAAAMRAASEAQAPPPDPASSGGDRS